MNTLRIHFFLFLAFFTNSVTYCSYYYEDVLSAIEHLNKPYFDVSLDAYKCSQPSCEQTADLLTAAHAKSIAIAHDYYSPLKSRLDDIAWDSFWLWFWHFSARRLLLDKDMIENAAPLEMAFSIFGAYMVITKSLSLINTFYRICSDPLKKNENVKTAHYFIYKLTELYHQQKVLNDGIYSWSEISF